MISSRIYETGPEAKAESEGAFIQRQSMRRSGQFGRGGGGEENGSAAVVFRPILVRLCRPSEGGHGAEAGVYFYWARFGDFDFWEVGVRRVYEVVVFFRDDCAREFENGGFRGFYPIVANGRVGGRGGSSHPVPG